MNMKLSFSTRNVPRGSFLDLCRQASDYGFSGFELYDALHERRAHSDSILRNEKRAEGKRHLNNRNLSVYALTIPNALNNHVEPDTARKELLQYVELAGNIDTPYVILRMEECTDACLSGILLPAVKAAEECGVVILLETVGYLCKVSRLLDILNRFATDALATCWNLRGTFFDSGSAPYETIRELGAYIRAVRIGDRKEDRNVLIGEGDLPLGDVIDALHSLNYSGPVCVDWNDEISDPDLVLTHFASTMADAENKRAKAEPIYYNRSSTGTFPWRRFDVINMTFSQVLDVIADLYPDQTAFRYTTLDYTRTYSEFREDVDKVAAGLIALGVKPGYHVAIWATNVPEWFLSFWATVKIGAVLVTVNTAYRISEIEYLLRQSDTHTLIMIEGSKDVRYGEIIHELCPELDAVGEGKPLFSRRLPFLRNVVTVGFEMTGCRRWEDLSRIGEKVPYAEVRHLASLVHPDDVCNMQYTSGTTGFPKGVMLTHNNILNDGKIIGDRMDLSTADRMMIQVPMFHCFGMVLSMTSMMTHGGTLCPLPYFSAKSALSCISSERITCFNGVPTMFIAMFNHPAFPSTDFSCMRTGIMAGSNCPPDLMRRASREMNMREIISVYGQTEASPGCTMGDVNEDLDHRVETVGSAFPGVECRIIDPETGSELPDGINGEFVARGFNIMKGYYKMPRETDEAIDRDGWLHSGDICCRTPDGYYKVTGRVKDMIIRGGENIYPREIEEFYLSNPKIRDIQVVGVPDPRYGEEACAWVILHDGESADAEELRSFGTSRIASHKVPRYFLFVDSFPMNAAGKILKYKMKEESMSRLHLEKDKKNI